MDDKLKTVEDTEIEDTQDTEIYIQGDVLDPIIKKQQEDVSKMRASLLCCNNDPSSFKQTISNITVLRIYHQLSRIIRYTELMDKLEEKLYESLEYTIDNTDPTNTATWMTLLAVQDKLQKSMIASHKLLQPYLKLREYDDANLVAASDNPSTIPLDAKSRDALRSNAQAILALLGGESNG